MQEKELFLSFQYEGATDTAGACDEHQKWVGGVQGGKEGKELGSLRILHFSMGQLLLLLDDALFFLLILIH